MSAEEIRQALDALVKDQKEVSGGHGQIRAEFKKSGCGSQAMNCYIRSANVRK
jgi:hypothetical protein